MKNLTKADVYDVALDLIEENGSTTTLNVKNELRNRNFYAKQADVSEFMIQIADDENWLFTYNGVHRVYKIGSGNSTQSNTSLSNQLKNTGKQKSATNSFTKNGVSGLSYTKRDGTCVETIDKQDSETGDYRVWSTVVNDELYFSSSKGYTRHDVRFAFAKITGSDFNDTRVKTLK